MPSSITRLAAIALLCVFATHLSAQDSDKKTAKKNPANLAGTWRYEYDWNETHYKDAIVVEQKKDKIAGHLMRNGKVVAPLKKGVVNGKEFSFTVVAQTDGVDWVARFKGAVNKDEIDGSVALEVNGETYDFDWTPTRTVVLTDLVGTWNVRIETPNGDVLEPTIQFAGKSGKVKAEYKSQQGMSIEVKKLRVEDNHVLFTIAGEFDGSTLTADYKGRPYGSKWEGTIDYDLNGATGQVEFSAVRKPAKKKPSKKATEKKKDSQ